MRGGEGGGVREEEGEKGGTGRGLGGGAGWRGGLSEIVDGSNWLGRKRDGGVRAESVRG